MPTILLVRHGQASFGASEYDRLSPLGVEQAAVAAGHLGSLGLDVVRVVCGGLRRQRESATPAAARFRREAAVDARWDEYDMDGILAAHGGGHARASVRSPDQAASPQEYQALLDRGLTAWILAGRDDASGESFAAFTARAHDAVRELAGELVPGSTGLAFTSAGVIAALCVGCLELPATVLPSFNRVAVNAGVTKLIVGRRGVTLVSFNDHAHLERSGVAITYL